MPIYSLRVDHSLQEVLGLLSKNKVGGFACRECVQQQAPQDGQAVVNEHWHFILYTELDLKQLRNKLLYAVPGLKGNASYSLTLCRDEDKYIRYLCKGESEGAGCEIVWHHGVHYSDQYFEEKHAEYWVENRKLRKRQLTGTVMDAVIDTCKQLRVQWDNREKISELYVKEVVARSKPVNLFSIKAAVNSIQCQLCPDDQAIKQMASQV